MQQYNLRPVSELSRSPSSRSSGSPPNHNMSPPSSHLPPIQHASNGAQAPIRRPISPSSLPRTSLFHSSLSVPLTPMPLKTSTCRMVKPCLQEIILHLPQAMTSCASSLHNHQSNRSSSSKAPPVYISVARSTNSSLRLAKRSSACVSNQTFLPPAVRARQKAKKPYRFPTHGPHTRMPHPLHHRRCNRPRSTRTPPRRCTLPLIPFHNIPTTIPIWRGVPPVQSVFRVRWRHHPRVMLRLLTIRQRSCATGLLQ